MKITVVPWEDTLDEFYKHKSNYFIIDALNQFVYFHCAERSNAQEECDLQFGKGKYTIRTNKMSKSSGEISCRGSMNSKSLSGSRLVSIRNSQGKGL